MSKIILGVILIGMVFLFGCTATQHTTDTTQGDVIEDSTQGAVEDDKVDSGEVIENNGNNGAPSFQRYTKAAFEQAKSEGKVIFLFFTANWCPTCARQHPVNNAAAANPEMLKDVALFNISFNDSDTNDEDKEISKEFGIVYQHTQVILDSQGNETYRSTGFVSEETIITRIKEAKI